MAKLGRKKGKEPSSPEEAEVRDAGRQRQVYKAGNSWVVAVPLWARKRIGVVGGGSVYWHDKRHEEVALTTSAKRIAGRPIGLALQRTVDRFRRENTLLRRQLRQAGAKAWNQYRSEEVGREIHLRISGLPALAAINDRLRDLSAGVDEIGRMVWRHVQSDPPPPSGSGPVSEEEKEAGDVPVPSAEAARASTEFSDSPATAEQ